MFCQNIVGSKSALLTNATKLDVSDIVSHAWFNTDTSISNFSGIEWDGRWQKMAYSSDHCCSKLYIKYSRLTLYLIPHLY